MGDLPHEDCFYHQIFLSQPKECTMDVIYIMIGISIAVALFFLVAFLWAVKTGQFEDDQTPAIRMLFDNQNSKSNNSNKSV